MKSFYDAFLRWRSDAGMDNAIADHLPEMLTEAGLKQINNITSQHEHANRTDDDFLTNIEIWAGVANFKGIQMVHDGFITEQQRVQAEADFRNWIKESAESQTMYLLTLEGMK